MKRSGNMPYEKLVESGEEETVRIRHLQYFLGLSEKIESGLLGVKQEEWFARAVDERDNLHAALEQAAKQDIEAGLYISGQTGSCMGKVRYARGRVLVG